MPLHITKIAFQSESPATLRAWLESHAGEARITTRYLPKRVEEMAGGSLYWIHGHMLVGRSPILGFEETGQGRYWVRLEPRLIPVRSQPKRAHQGWRYLEGKDAPADLNDGEMDDRDAMPPALLGELTRLGLV
ncbi:hypothetical protein SAMN05518849_101137 [Sphingobium sp. AP50]|jgi:hypothetical protein|uniref:DUF1489 family protein n=1 Tax=unclassified Sphingobium TaxID=2611147 RepID=UPI0008D0DAEE|nr:MULTISPECIES: DUF1489 domain-containing protein [unclassified Sphingobium]SEI57589.1 hypothetical protein SAMN05518849_101137 [Sphingobium sp. AP50]SER39478.1 hypothetical protein SAMN05518866_11066 [Sphingobium sp. YR768]